MAARTDKYTPIALPKTQWNDSDVGDEGANEFDADPAVRVGDGRLVIRATFVVVVVRGGWLMMS